MEGQPKSGEIFAVNCSVYSLVMPLVRGWEGKKGVVCCLEGVGKRAEVLEGAQRKEGGYFLGWGIFWRPSRPARFALIEARGGGGSLMC